MVSTTKKTDDAQVEANISPVIPRVSGCVKEVSKRQPVCKKVIHSWYWTTTRDFALRLMQAEAALANSQNKLQANANTNASRANYCHLCCRHFHSGCTNWSSQSKRVANHAIANAIQTWSKTIHHTAAIRAGTGSKAKCWKTACHFAAQKAQVSKQTSAVATQSTAAVS